jgi:hypothetical protein
MEKKLEFALPIEFPEPSMGDGYAPLFNSAHPLSQYEPKLTSKWLDGWTLAYKIVKKMLTKHSLKLVAFAYSTSPLTDGFNAFINSPKLKQTNRITMDLHTLNDPELSSRKSTPPGNVNLHRFLEISARKLFPNLDIVINDIDPMRKNKKMNISNSINLIRMVRRNGFLIARWTDPRDWDAMEIHMLNWLEQYGEVKVWISPYPGRPVYMVLKVLNNVSDKDMEEIQETLVSGDVYKNGKYTSKNQKELADRHSVDKGNATGWSERFLEYISE